MVAHIFQFERVDTPTGRMLLASDERGKLRAAEWEDHTDRMLRLFKQRYGAKAVELREVPTCSAASRALRAYFAGDLKAIDDIPTATNGTDFQKKVWAALRRLPVGRTLTYGALAAKIGHPNAIRALGHANGSNPIAIFVPCHRLIGANASLTGYGGGIDRKRWLLIHEGAQQSLPDAAE